MFFTNLLVLLGRRALLGSFVLCLKIVLADFACIPAAWHQALRAQWAITALLGAVVIYPAVVFPITEASARRFSLRATQFIACLVEGEDVCLKQLRVAGRLLFRRHIDCHLRSVGVITEPLEHGPVVAHPIEGELLNVVAVNGFFARDQSGGVGRFVGVGRQQVEIADQIGIGVQADIKQLTIVEGPMFTPPRVAVR